MQKRVFISIVNTGFKQHAHRQVLSFINRRTGRVNMCTVHSIVYSVQSIRGTSSLFWHTQENGESQFRRLEKKLSTLPTLWIGLQGSYLHSPTGWLSLKLRKNPPKFRYEAKKNLETNKRKSEIKLF
jgi:hypothetical protein